MAKINNWSFDGFHINGIIVEHPLYHDGEPISTSRVVGAIDDKLVTRSGSVYELGTIDPAYEALYPNARERLFKTIKERS